MHTGDKIIMLDANLKNPTLCKIVKIGERGDIYADAVETGIRHYASSPTSIRIVQPPPEYDPHDLFRPL